MSILIEILHVSKLFQYRKYAYLTNIITKIFFIDTISKIYFLPSLHWWFKYLKSSFNCFRLLDSIKMTNSINNQRQPASFAISDILELDRQHNPHPELDPSMTEALYTTTDLSYIPRHWPQIPDHGKFKKINSLMTF